MIFRSLVPCWLALLAALQPASVAAQQAGDAHVAVTVTAEGQPLVNAEVRSSRGTSWTDSAGTVRLALPAGSARILAGRAGYGTDTVELRLRAGQDTSVFLELVPVPEALAPIMVRAGRSEVRIEEEPERVEVLAPEDVQEKTLTSPGSLRNVLTEMAGVRVQAAAPGLGGAAVRIHGVPGQYSLLLTDGLPLQGGRAPAFGLVQMTPLDLRQVEVIKGAATALYGPAGLGGVVDLVSRPPGGRREVVLGGSTRGGTDAVLWWPGRLSPHWGYTVLAGGHAQGRQDPNGDGWAELPGYVRAEARPRLSWTGGSGSKLLVTAGATGERRTGGTVPGGRLPDGTSFPEELDTRHWDAGAIGQFLLGAGRRAGIRAAAAGTRHDRTLGAASEQDRRSTLLGELTVGQGLAGHDASLGVAAQRDVFRTAPRAELAETFTDYAAFATDRYTPFPALALAAAVRVDRHSRYGSFFSPRLSALVRTGGTWTVRLSAARGFEAPSVGSGETEEVGFARLGPRPRLHAERGTSGSVDAGGTIGPVQLNASWFRVRIEGPVLPASVAGDPTAFTLQNAAGPIRSSGVEGFAAYAREPFLVTASYSHSEATQLTPGEPGRVPAVLVPRNAGGVDVAWEEDEPGESGLRAALEIFYTGRQWVEDNPYRTRTRPYTTVELLLSKQLGQFTVFASGENLTSVRQTRWDPLLRPWPGRGGRWTTDEWAPLEGRTITFGVRGSF